MAKMVAQAKGEAKSQIERARGEAEANRLRNASLTPQLLELKPLETDRARIEKWNGDVPRMVVGDKTGMMLQMPYDADSGAARRLQLMQVRSGRLIHPAFFRFEIVMGVKDSVSSR